MKTKTIVKRVIDVALTVTLLLLMAFQVTEQLAHEWLGVTMFALTIVHQILNRKFYSAIFKGKYSLLRVFQLTVNVLLLLCFVCTALSGMMMSRFATPFMNGILPSSIVRQGHLALSHWSFVLMGLHLGLHFGIITSKLKNKIARIILGIVMTGVSVYGFYLFFKSDMLSYMLFKNPFAFLDYEKAWWLVISENLAMLLAWGFAAYLLSLILRSFTKKDKRKAALLYALLLIAVIISGIVLNAAFNPAKQDPSASWSAPKSEQTQSNTPAQAGSADNKEPSDNYIKIKGGSFIIGSPESENWRGNDETPHKVTVGDFYISPYEITQAEYRKVTGANPSTFTGDDLPVENISFLEALNFANKKSETEGLTPVYKISGQTVTWNRRANGYRLPTEAEWEYACRAEQHASQE
ncbi:MAG: SUMF1/EgtB/PvdO family nonheme iron enzyme [Ruminococcus sp.]|nr:SUMF1/EgtB/PvdO family nonheme iron enzyme [Ruminococcus sp.]